MSNKILTVIIPIYNMECYLRECLDSLKVSVEQMEQLEVLMVNDGSKDSSLLIMKEYAEAFPDTFIIIDKNNGNYGSCINAGLRVATGKYVKVLDADDFFFTRDFLAMIKELTQIDADIILTGYSLLHDKTNVLESKTLNIPYERMLSIDDIILASYIPMHAVAYKLEILRNIDYKQTEGVSYTDQEWIFSPMSQVSKVCHLNLTVYAYRIGRDGQTMDEQVHIKKIEDEFKVLANLAIEHKRLSVISSHGNARYLTMFLERRISQLYRLAFMSKEVNLDKLRVYDSQIIAAYPQALKITNDLKYADKFPFHYVRAWRKGKSCKRMLSAYSFYIKARNLFKV